MRRLTSYRLVRLRVSAEYQRDFHHQSAVNCVTLHPDQTELISGDQEGRVIRWDLRANQCIEHLIPEPDVAVRSVDIASDGSYVAVVNNKVRGHSGSPPGRGSPSYGVLPPPGQMLCVEATGGGAQSGAGI